MGAVGAFAGSEIGSGGSKLAGFEAEPDAFRLCEDASAALPARPKSNGCRGECRPSLSRVDRLVGFLAGFDGAVRRSINRLDARYVAYI